MNSLKDFLKKSDIFGNSVTLNYQGKNTIKTSIGGLMTVIYCLTIIILIVFSTVFYSKNNPPIWSVINKFRINNTIEKIPKNALFIANNFINTKAPQPTSYKTKPLNIQFESIFSQLTPDVKNNIVKTKLGEFSKCLEISNNSTVPKDDYDLFLERFNETALCFNFIKDLEVGGDIYYTKNSQKGVLRFDINICDIIGIKDCKAQDIVNSNKDKKALKLRYFYNNYYANINEDDGYTSFLKTGEFDVDLYYNYDIKLLLKKNIMKTDANIIYSFFPIEEKVFYWVDILIDKKLNFDLDLVTNIKTNKNKIYNLKISYEFILDDTDVIWERSYVKLNTLLGNIYSLSRLIYAFCRIFVVFISGGLFSYKFSKKISIFKKEKKIKPIQNKNFKIKDIEFFKNESKKNNFNNLKNNGEFINFHKETANILNTPKSNTESLNIFINEDINKRNKIENISDINREIDINQHKLELQNLNPFLNKTESNIHKKFDSTIQNKHLISNKNLITFDNTIRDKINSDNNKTLPHEHCYTLEQIHVRVPTLNDVSIDLKKSNTLRSNNIKNKSSYNIINDVISNDKKSLIHNEIENKKDIYLNTYSDYTYSSKEKSENKIDSSKIYQDIHKNEVNIDPINNVKANDIMEQGIIRHKKFLKKLKTINLDDSNKINLRIGKIFVILKNMLACFFKKNKDYKTLEITKQISEHELNIVHIIRKLIEYDNLKSILIDESKIDLLKYLQKRVFTDNMELENVKQFYNNIFYVKTILDDDKIKEYNSFQSIQL